MVAHKITQRSKVDRVEEDSKLQHERVHNGGLYLETH